MRGTANEQLCDHFRPLRVDAAIGKGGARCAASVFGIGINGQPDIDAGEALIAAQYLASGKTEAEAGKEVAALNACFGTYEVPPENRSPAKSDIRNASGTAH